MHQRPEIITAAIAAFGSDGELDKGANLEFLRRCQPLVDGVLAAGTTAEFPSLDAHERTELIAWSLETLGPKRTIAQIGAPSTHQALHLMSMAAAEGACRFAAITPYYLKASQEAVIDYYLTLREHADGALYAYIFPDVANTDIFTQTVARLAAGGIDGIKLSGAASSRVALYHQAAPGLTIWSGNDADTVGTMTAGGNGTISGVSGVIPQPWAKLRDAMAAGDEHRTITITHCIEKLVSVLGPSISRLKYALTQLGIPAGQCRMPIDEPDDTVKRMITALLAGQR